MQLKGRLVSGDLEENTITIEMEEPIILKAGEYMVIPIEEFKQQIIDAYNKVSMNTAEQYYKETFNK
jgi:hypothetical protein